VAAALPGATGNKGAIAFARAQAHAYASVPGVRYTEVGFTAMVSGGRKKPVFSWSFGRGRPAGWVNAAEQVTLGLSKDRVSWMQDTLTPPAHSKDVPVEILVEHSGQYFRLLSGILVLLLQAERYDAVGSRRSVRGGRRALRAADAPRRRCDDDRDVPLGQGAARHDRVGQLSWHEA
jgi:hypothetical protein